MDWSHKLCIAALLIVAAAIPGIQGDAVVSGSVFCDQCRDGEISLFDYPLYGVNITMVCPSSDGEVTTWAEETTNWVGSYAMRFQGSPDLSSCFVQVSGGGQGSKGCGAAPGPPKSVKLMLRVFDTEMYTVDPLISQPAEPMSFCPRSSPPVPTPVTPVQPPPLFSVPKPVTPAKPPPTSPLPPLPRLPPTPFIEASACSHQKWAMPEYRCHWKVVTPDTKVAVAFGLIAARRYGTDLTLGKGLQGRGEAYSTLLREGTTALLNSYSSILFPINTVAVLEHMNWALMGSTEQVLHTAIKFMRANSGYGRVPCKITPCK